MASGNEALPPLDQGFAAALNQLPLLLTHAPMGMATFQKQTGKALGWVLVYAAACSSAARAQAAVEYAARSAGTAVSAAAHGMHLGVCPLDRGLVPCVHTYYPGPFYVAVGVICVLFLRLIAGRRRT